ncbi:heavy metal translocating P-type ATPase [Candidatus Albibeggiatoa sp. nov. NOAA]|uniref:heavy metal translocating P-type ATPase n=1 Tax=Candidatus Albibeggiatoa sp. nov. NOAA TaxID=3162724 RepID=UPI0032F404BC|nr:heavy metal translocating P-type ATPase [Thiotrichaceae bacterium]
MLPLIPIILGGAVVASAFSLKKIHDAQVADSVEPDKNLQTPTKQTLPKQILNNILSLEATYQNFIQRHVDPLFGQTRHQHLQEFSSNELRELSEEERYANLRIGIGGAALVSALIGTFVYTPFMAVAVVLGMSIISTFYYIAYLEWKRTHKLGSIHLTCIYDAFLWLGGYAAIGSLGMFLIGIGLKIKVITEAHAHQHLSDIFQLQPSTVWVRIEGNELEIPFEKLAIGDTLVLHGGQVVPVDGKVIAGTATVDQHALTGEAQPVEKILNEQVFASTLIISGTIDVKVEKTGAETTAGRLGAILEETAKYNASTTLKVMEASDRYTWPTLALSAASLPFIGPARAISIMGANSTFNTYITGSMVVLNFLNATSENAILVKDCKALENINDINLIIFDKTGTLTVEQPTVECIHLYSDYNETQILAFAAAAEARQTHPIASAILTAAAASEVSIPAIEDTHYALGFGLKVKLIEENKTLRVGSARFLEQENIELPAQFEQLSQACHTEGHSLVMVALDEICIGSIELRPRIRPETQQIIQRLKQQNIEICIISGDQDIPTRKLAEELGIDNYFANVLPEGKAELVTQFQQKGHHVCFIGDGINDAIAMHKAEVSISLRGATTAATDAAQIILMDSNLNKLPELFAIAEKFEHRLAQNLNFTTGVSVLALAGIFLGGFSFIATEILYVVSLTGGLAIAVKPISNAITQSNQSLDKEV